MKANRLILNAAALVGVILLLTPLSACGLINQSSGHDNDIIEELQKEVPFTIVTPTYFPEGIEPYPSNIGGPSKGSDEVVGLTLGYRERGTNNGIFIIEENREVIFIPSGSSAIYLDFAGTQVLEEEGEFLFLAQTDTKVPQLRYLWNSDGVNVDVTTLGYERDEARKVISSMIQPIE